MNDVWTEDERQERETCMRDLFVALSHHLRTGDRDSIEDVLLAERINAIVDRYEVKVLLSTGCDLLKAIAAELVARGVTAIPSPLHVDSSIRGLWEVHRAALLATSALMAGRGVWGDAPLVAESKVSAVITLTLIALDESDRNRAMTLFDAVAYSCDILQEVLEPGTAHPTPTDAIQRLFERLARSEYVAIQPPRIHR